MTGRVLVEIPLRLGNGLNDHRSNHWGGRSKRVESERDSIAWSLVGKTRPELPCKIQITRIAPSNGLDDDNLAGACKAVRDQLAKWIGVDDRRKDIVRYVYENERGDWGVRVEVVL